MRTPLNIDDFESYLEEEVNQHRMYPSDYVWRNIQHDLHGYKKWPALTVITLFVISALVAGTLLIKPKRQSSAIAQAAISQTATEANGKADSLKENVQQHFSPEHITQQTMASVVSEDIDINGAFQNAFNTFHGIAGLPQGSEIYDNTTPADAAPATTNIITALNTNGKDIAEPAGTEKARFVTSPQPSYYGSINAGFGKNAKALVSGNRFVWMKTGNFDNQEPDRFYYSRGVWKAVYGSIFYLTADRLPSYGDFAPVNSSEKKFTNQAERNNFKIQPKSSRFYVLAYFTPSVSYRILSHAGSKANICLPGANNGPGNLVNINSLLNNNQSATGYDAGAAVGYKISSTFTLRAGLQFNYRQYNVQEAGENAGTAMPVSEPGTGTPNTGSSGVAAGVDLSMQGAQGKQQAPVVITNSYYQVALPVGADWKAWSGGKFTWNIAATIQPVYTIYNAPFVVPTSNGGSADGSSIMRKWNINSSVESYVSYTTGKFRWQLGPQAGYELLSTLKGSYPVTEHLLNYGIKIGVVRSLP